MLRWLALVWVWFWMPVTLFLLWALGRKAYLWVAGMELPGGWQDVPNWAMLALIGFLVWITTTLVRFLRGDI